MSTPQTVIEPWWDEDAKDPVEVAKLVFATVKDIERRQQSIHDGHRRHAQIYCGYTPVGLQWSDTQGVRTRAPHEVTRSVIRSVCDTATALISKFRPKPTFVTDAANWEVQRMATDLDRFMVGAYEAGDVYHQAARAFHDSTVFGTGVYKLVPSGSGQKFRVRSEHVLIDDLVVDEDECREHLEPVNTYHRVPMRADALIRKYAQGNDRKSRERRAAIEAAKGQLSSGWPGSRYVAPDKVIVIEAIHVDEDNPGRSRRVLCVEGVALEDGDWEFPWHPYVVLWWATPPSGFYGDGIAYRQFGRQQRITYLYRWAQRCHDLFATPRAWVDPAGGPPTLQMSNEIGAIIMTRRPPVFQTPSIIPPEVYRWIDMLERGAFEDEGISQASAANQLPPGIESAPAQREYSFKESSRFAPVSQRWEDAVAVETCRKMLAMYRAAGSGGKGASIPWADRKLRQVIDWAVVKKLEDDAYQIRPEASSLESLSPAARTQAAIELSQTGWIGPEEGRRLLGHPDLEESNDIDTAPRQYAEYVLQQLLRNEPMAVCEYADLSEVHKVVVAGYLLAKMRGAPNGILANIERYLEELDSVQATANQAAASMNAMAGGGPAGAPQPGMSPQAAQGSPVALPGG